MDTQPRQYSIGLQFLDRRLGGGIAAGTLLALTSPPHSQSELLLRQFLRSRPSLFVSTIRPVEEVRTWATTGGQDPPDLRCIRRDPEALLEDPSILVEEIAAESFVIIDRTNALETAPRGEYLEFLDQLAAALRETHSVGVLHCSDVHQAPPRRGLTLDRVDQVWQLEILQLSREIKNRLLVTKSRRSRALREPIDLLMTDRVQVDTSRKIA